MGASLYEPINVYKPVAPNIGIVDGPFEYLTVGGVKMPLPFTTRMTVVRLSNGDLFLHPALQFPRLHEKLRAGGSKLDAATVTCQFACLVSRLYRVRVPLQASRVLILHVSQKPCCNLQTPKSGSTFVDALSAHAAFGLRPLPAIATRRLNSNIARIQLTRLRTTVHLQPTFTVASPPAQSRRCI